MFVKKSYIFYKMLTVKDLIYMYYQYKFFFTQISNYVLSHKKSV